MNKQNREIFYNDHTIQFKSHWHRPEDYGNVQVREKINKATVEFNIHWRDIERWAWKRNAIRTRTFYTYYKEMLTWCSGEVREWCFIALGQVWWVLARAIRRITVSLPIGQRLWGTGREGTQLYHGEAGVEGWRNCNPSTVRDETRLVTRINFWLYIIEY